MRWVRSRPKAGTPMPPDVPTDTLAGAAAYGLTSGSGHVAPWNQLGQYHGGDLITPMGPREIVADAAYLPDNPPDSIYADRPLYGGVRAFPAFGQYVEGPPFTGAFRVVANRPPLVMVEGGAMEPQTYVEDATWREPPATVDLCRRVPDVGGDQRVIA